MRVLFYSTLDRLLVMTAGTMNMTVGDLFGVGRTDARDGHLKVQILTG